MENTAPESSAIAVMAAAQNGAWNNVATVDGATIDVLRIRCVECGRKYPTALYNRNFPLMQAKLWPADHAVWVCEEHHK